MFEQTFRNIDDVLWKEAGCATELDYTEQTSWMLFLKYMDDLEFERSQEAELRGQFYQFIIDEDHRWSRWAAPRQADGSFGSQAEKHELSHLYEAKIRNMGNTGRNGGEYYLTGELAEKEVDEAVA